MGFFVEKRNNLFLRFFPFPEYLRMSAVGIDISDRSIKYTAIKNMGGDLRLKNYGYKSVEPGVVEKGEIKNKVRLAEILKTVKQSLDDFFITVSLPEEKAFLKVIDLPPVKKEKIRESLRLQLEETVPFSPENIIFDFDVLEESSDGWKVVFSAFPKKIAEDYAKVFEHVGFFPVSFEVESQSLFRSLADVEEKGGVMIIDFGKTRTSFVIGEDGSVKFSSTINVAGEHLDKILSKGLNIDVFEAEEMKRKNVSFESGKDKLLTNILPVISVIKDESVRILDYWQTHGEEQSSKNKKIEKIILCGGDSSIPGLTEYFSYYLKTSVELGNPWVNINSFENYAPEMERAASLRYATALGLAIRSFDRDSFYD